MPMPFKCQNVALPEWLMLFRIGLMLSYFNIMFYDVISLLLRSHLKATVDKISFEGVSGSRMV